MAVLLRRKNLNLPALQFGSGSTINDRFDKLCNDLSINDALLLDLTISFYEEIEASLTVHKENPHNEFDRDLCDFIALDTCLNNLPDGSETGVFYGVDLGGSSIRVLRCNLKGKGKVSTDYIKENIVDYKVDGKTLMHRDSTATMLFDYIADKVQATVHRCGDDDKAIDAGFSFSFAADQLTIDKAVVKHLGKDFETGNNTSDPVLGVDIIASLNSALRRKKVNATIVGSLNDTTATLITASYLKGKCPAARLGLIVGTGFNICLAIDQSTKYGYQGKVINLETGGYSGAPKTIIDLDVDLVSANINAQPYEKKISGKYIPELVRFAIIRVFQSKAPEGLWKEEAFTTEECCNIFNAHCTDFKVARRDCKRLMLNKFGLDVDGSESRIICKLIVKIIERSAKLVAIALAACALRSGRLQKAYGGLTVGVDGSLYCLNPHYQSIVREGLNILLKGRAKMVHILPSRDSSSIGAALLAMSNAKSF